MEPCEQAFSVTRVTGSVIGSWGTPEPREPDLASVTSAQARRVPLAWLRVPPVSAAEGPARAALRSSEDARAKRSPGLSLKLACVFPFSHHREQPSPLGIFM